MTRRRRAQGENRRELLRPVQGRAVPISKKGREMDSVKVWDPFVRLFHWSLVVAVIGLYATAETLPQVHVRIGYSVVFLVLARILWGQIGRAHV